MTLLTLSIADACLALSLSRSSIYKLIKQGRLKTLKIGSRTLLTVESIKALDVTPNYHPVLIRASALLLPMWVGEARGCVA
ncbi:MAG: hypothetical protein CFE32_18725 [Alphaproteobacteria bacterium PA3]|nr:MAG: hypothetical protein CFE32_18725 [Alphaproteobacteria bacterium PA3]